MVKRVVEAGTLIVSVLTLISLSVGVVRGDGLGLKPLGAIAMEIQYCDTMIPKSQSGVETYRKSCILLLRQVGLHSSLHYCPLSHCDFC
jgi:hypothetical protein